MPPAHRGPTGAPIDRWTTASPTAIASGFNAAMALGPQPKIATTSNLNGAAGSSFADMDSEDDEDEDDDEDDNGSPAAGGTGKVKGKGKQGAGASGRGKKGMTGSRSKAAAALEHRKEQNRAAQREFRQRKQQYIRALEARVELLSSDHDTQVDRLRFALRQLLAENNTLRTIVASLASFIGNGAIGGCMAEAGLTRQELEDAMNNRSEKTMTEAWQNWPGAKECEALKQIRLESNIPAEGLPESKLPYGFSTSSRAAQTSTQHQSGEHEADASKQQQQRQQQTSSNASPADGSGAGTTESRKRKKGSEGMEPGQAAATRRKGSLLSGSTDQSASASAGAQPEAEKSQLATPEPAHPELHRTSMGPPATAVASPVIGSAGPSTGAPPTPNAPRLLQGFPTVLHHSPNLLHHSPSLLQHPVNWLDRIRPVPVNLSIFSGFNSDVIAYESEFPMSTAMTMPGLPDGPGVLFDDNPIIGYDMSYSQAAGLGTAGSTGSGSLHNPSGDLQLNEASSLRSRPAPFGLGNSQSRRGSGSVPKTSTNVPLDSRQIRKHFTRGVATLNRTLQKRGIKEFIDLPPDCELTAEDLRHVQEMERSKPFLILAHHGFDGDMQDELEIRHPDGNVEHRILNRRQIERIEDSFIQLSYHQHNLHLNPNYRLPAILQPTRLQQTHPHSPLIDAVPWAPVRDALILYPDLDLEEVVFEMMRSIEVHDGDFLMEMTWEIHRPFFVKFPMVAMTEGGERLLKQTNAQRAKRGQPPLTLEGLWEDHQKFKEAEKKRWKELGEPFPLPERRYEFSHKG